MVPEPSSREFVAHAKWATVERNSLTDELAGFEAGRSWIGPQGKVGFSGNMATSAHITYLRDSIGALNDLIAACIEAAN